ncbi:thiamine phosphate synthase [Selenomonas sputigena]|uniref:Putative thiamine-phosphate diphosphorylase n=1 Tax=Selenomonas sputigena (strain ATCC 35185 / DSM 20758 / CCUG 44933 / VPI D19B-28) TaxID=546271 RepID=C9LXN1_SELS3|nr:thiamine phosphate synthase [Selenomonas sputigena]AEB99427.1 thiamine monophosphate synthase [Selenomonas sputigena ATCC 35185]EEX76414.1 putative thiamine-phosphate diphosphorylase [Selenomonas sputigena ATCC 35185]
MYRGRIIACITNRRLVKGDFLAQIERVAAMEMADWIIVREKDLSVEEYRMLFAKVARIVHKGGKKCLAHGRIALGMMSELGADGIHLPLDVLREWRAASGRRSAPQAGAVQLVGASAHSAAEIAEAVALGADYATLSPIFVTACKPGAVPLGIAALAAVCKESPIPIFALGGIGMDKLDACIEAGAAGCCMMSELMRCM